MQAFLPVLRANDFAVWLSAAAGREKGGRENAVPVRKIVRKGRTGRF